MAVRVCPYQSIKEFYSLSFFSPSDEEKRLEIIVPSPDLADLVRERIREHRLYGNISVITVSYFISRKMQEINCPKPVLRKAHVLLHFSAIWQNYFPNESYALFNQSYEIFSDWRSFSTDITLFEEALNLLDPVIKKAVMFFWTYLEQMEFLDEHGAYDYLAKNITEQNCKADLLFFGFTHLSGTQIAMLHQLSNNCELFIPIHYDVVTNSQSTDWIKWLTPITQKNSEKNKSSSLEIQSWVTFEKSELNSIVLRENTKCLILGAQDSLADLAEIHTAGDFFKISYDFLNEIEQGFSDQFRDAFLGNKHDVLKQYLSEEKTQSVATKNWRKLKIIELHQEAIEFLSSVDLEYNAFLFSVIRQYVQLNMPRTYVLTINEKFERQILKAEYLWAPELDNAIDIVVKSDDSIFRSGTLNYTSEVFKCLSSIGPIQRLGLRGEWLKNHLVEVLKCGGGFFIEEGLLEASSFWKEQARINKEKRITKENKKLNKNFVWELKCDSLDLAYLKEKTFSASELQKYIDCPRSYFVSYVLNLDAKIKNDEEFSPSELGELEHLLVEKYFSLHDFFDSEKLSELALSILSQSLGKLSKSIGGIDVEVILEELITYSENVLLKLYQLKILPGFEFEFEKEFKNLDFGIHGRVDFYFKTNYGHGIIDFKRSKIPTYSEVASASVVQLWTYLFGMNLDLENCTLEYSNLSDPTKSWGIGKEASAHIVKIPKAYRAEVAEAARTSIQKVIEEIRQGQGFPIKPRKSSVCLYCPAQALCPRVERQHSEAAC